MKKKIMLLCFMVNYCYAINSLKSWHLAIMPAAWKVQTNGRIKVATKTTHVNKTDLGGAVNYHLQYGQIGVLGNILYSELSKTRNSVFYQVKATNKYGIISSALFYEKWFNPFFNVKPYLGARYTFKNTYLTITFNRSATIKPNQNINWIDPIMGGEANYYYNQWQATISGDIGGLNTTTQYSYNFQSFIAYFPNGLHRALAIFAGYQILGQRYQQGSNANLFDWNIKLFGPYAGFMLNF